MNGGDSNHQAQNQNQMIYPHHYSPHSQWIAAQYHQQQWLAMQQYQAAAPVMYHPHYVPYYPQYLPHKTPPFVPPPPPTQYYFQPQHVRKNQSSNLGGDDGDNRTIWIGDLKDWMDEDYLRSCFEQSGEVVSVKIIRNKHTGQSDRYGFIEFSDHATADNLLQTYNGTTMPNTDQQFRLNWAAFSSGGLPEAAASGSDLSIFVGDLATDVTDAVLLDTFVSKYPSVKGAKVVIDSNSGRSKGYGFVRFGDENERSRALTEMNGLYCSSRPMRIAAATPKKLSSHQQFSSQGHGGVVLSGGGQANGNVHEGAPENDTSNTTIFVGGLDSDVTEEELKESFAQFGDIVSVKIPAGKRCGFVQFSNRSNAEEAIEKLNGSTIGKQTVRLSWGRNIGNKKWDGSYNGRQAGFYGNGYFAAGSAQQQPADS